jgi:hypothetical protein
MKEIPQLYGILLWKFAYTFVRKLKIYIPLPIDTFTYNSQKGSPKGYEVKTKENDSTYL